MSAELHAILPPSSAGEWVNCHGSILLSSGIVEEDTEDSMNGVAVHWAGEEMLKGRGVSAGDSAPNGVIMTGEMVDAASLYYDTIRQDTLHISTNLLRIEERVNIPDVHALNWGTPDCWHYNTYSNVLKIWDLKFGHRRVNAFENWQMLDYVIGIVRLLFPEDAFQGAIRNISIEISIVQPRCFDGKSSVDRWRLAEVDLRGYINRLNAAAEAALSATPACTVGSHCCNCKGRLGCNTFTDAASAFMDFSGAAISGIPTDAALAREYVMISRASDLLKSRMKSIEVETLKRMSAGKSLPGLVMEQGFTNSKWTKPVADIITLGETLGVDLRKPEDVVTPNQAAGLIKKKGIDGSVINAYHGKHKSSMKLKIDDYSEARRLFN